MSELLDDAIATPAKKYPIPSTIKIVGSVLAVLWTFLLYTRIEMIYVVARYALLIDLLLIGLMGLLLYPSYQSQALQGIKWKYYILVPCLIACLIIGEAMGDFIQQNWYSNTFLRDLLVYTARIGLIYLLTHFVLKAYKEQPDSTSIWQWLYAAMTYATIAIFINTIGLGTEWYTVWKGWIFPLLFVVLMIYTIQFYSQTRVKAISTDYRQRMHWFIGAVGVVILGRAIPKLDPNSPSYSIGSFFLEICESLSFWSIGMTWLVIYYAWADSRQD